MKITSFLIVVVVVVSENLACKHFEWNPLYNSYHLAALVLARGNSKGIPLKNLSKVGGISILTRTLNVVKAVSGFSSVWVSTENDLIFKEALLTSDLNVHWRSQESATDNATSIFAVQEFIERHPQIDAIALVQCTSPFIKSEYLNEAIYLFNGGFFPCVFSATKSYKLRWVLKNGFAVPLNFDIQNRPRRQDFQAEIIENGMFYFSTRKYIKNGYFQNSNRSYVISMR